MKHSGFTIVELIIVVIVIGILATVTLTSYRSVQQSATLAKVQTDLSAINDGIQIYKAKKGHYPLNGWVYSCQYPDTFQTLVGEYIDSVPQAPCTGPGATDDSWLYMGDGTGSGYKLIHHKPTSIAPVKDQIPTELRDPVSYGSSPGGTWGFWTEDFSGWSP